MTALRACFCDDPIKCREVCAQRIGALESAIAAKDAEIAALKLTEEERDALEVVLDMAREHDFLSRVPPALYAVQALLDRTKP